MSLSEKNVASRLFSLALILYSLVHVRPVSTILPPENVNFIGTTRVETFFVFLFVTLDSFWPVVDAG
jgi:hypothetical protein